MKRPFAFHIAAITGVLLALMANSPSAFAARAATKPEKRYAAAKAPAKHPSKPTKPAKQAAPKSTQKSSKPAAPAFVVEPAVAAPSVTLKVPQPGKAADNTPALTVEVWPRVVDSILRLSPAKRHVYVENVHGRLNAKQYTAAEEPIVYGILSVLHASDSQSRYAAVGFVGDLKLKWPQFVLAEQTEALWRAYLNLFSSDSPADELALSQIAGLMKGFKAKSDRLDAEFSFYHALSLNNEGKGAEALNELSQVPLDSENYRKAKFLEASLLLKQNRLDDAQDALQIIISLEQTPAEKRSRVQRSKVQRVRELAVLNMARILYEQKRFGESVAYYRSLNQDSNYFYESLAEQGWPFFMAGYPNRALGAAYAATSPFFTHYLNPDSYYLKAAVFYWMCQFDLAFQSVQEFIEHGRLEGDPLRNLVAQTNAMGRAQSLAKYAKILEDDNQGVSYQNIGIGPKTLAVLKAKPNLKKYVDSLEAVTNQRNRVARPEVFNNGRDRILTSLVQFEARLREALGEAVKIELNVLAGDFDKALTQVRLIHLEVLTARKDSILGKERTVQGAEFVGQEKEFMEMSTGRNQKWNQDKNEFWYDELGHYVFALNSQCKTATKTSSK